MVVKKFSLKKYLPGIVMCLVILIPGLLGWWENSELLIYDNWFQLHGVQNPGQKIVIIGIDEKSISQLGALPWSRDIHARLLQQLGSAKVVAFDLLFDTARDQSSDQALADAIRKQGNVVLSSIFTYEPDGKGGYLLAIKPPIDILVYSCSGLGFINMAADQRNTVRKTTLFYPFTDERIYPSFSLAVYLASQSLDNWQLHVNGSELVAGNKEFKVENNNQAYLDFWGPGQTFTTYSYTDVLNGKISPGQFKGKIVLIGITSPTEKDYYNNPYTQGNMVSEANPAPGVEIHANALQSMLSESFFTRAPGYFNLLVLLAVWGLSMLTSRRSSPWKSLVLTVMLALFLSGVIYSIWLYGHFWINLAAPLFMMAATYTGNTAENVVKTNLEKLRIRNMFSRYVSSAVVNTLLQQEQQLELGGTNREISILFSDMRNFTGYSEGRSAQEVVARLNEYFTAMTDIVFHHGGTLDKYLGDGLLAYFGAPLELPDHAGQALKAAAEMLDAVNILNGEWQARGETTMDIGLGIHSGMVVVGNIGSPRRMEYTIVGEPVNLASRLEGLNKEMHTNVIFSEDIYSRVENFPIGWTVKDLGEKPVRGLTNAVKIYTLISESGSDVVDAKDGVKSFAEQ